MKQEFKLIRDTQHINLKSYGKYKMGIPLYQTVNFTDEFTLWAEYQRDKIHKIVAPQKWWHVISKN